MLYGSGDEKIEFTLPRRDAAARTQRKHAFEGILPNLERRYRETDSAAVREELAKYLSDAALPRLRRHAPEPRGAQRVRRASAPLPEIARAAARRGARRSSRSSKLAGWRGEIADKIVKEIGDRLQFLIDVGLDYLTLDRSADTLSGGEAQRIRLASQIGSGLIGVMYVLDEPSIGLHQRDNERLLGTLTHLRDLGNTRDRRRARRGRDPRRRPRRRHRARAPACTAARSSRRARSRTS